MRSRKLQRLIDDMNIRSEQWGCSESEEGNSWLHFFLAELGEYRGIQNARESGWHRVVRDAVKKGWTGMKRKRTFELVVYEDEDAGRINHYYGTEAKMYELANEMYDKGYFCRLYYIWSDGHRTEL